MVRLNQSIVGSVIHSSSKIRESKHQDTIGMERVFIKGISSSMNSEKMNHSKMSQYSQLGVDINSLSIYYRIEDY